jgi:hypothetical protein
VIIKIGSHVRTHVSSSYSHPLTTAQGDVTLENGMCGCVDAIEIRVDSPM